MGEIVNLRKARKARLRAEKAGDAAENRARHGRTLAEVERVRLESELAERRLEGGKVEPG